MIVFTHEFSRSLGTEFGRPQTNSEADSIKAVAQYLKLEQMFTDSVKAASASAARLARYSNKHESRSLRRRRARSNEPWLRGQYGLLECWMLAGDLEDGFS